jgi:recombination protein RecA
MSDNEYTQNEYIQDELELDGADHADAAADSKKAAGGKKGNKKKDKAPDSSELFSAKQDEGRAKALESALADLTRRFGDGTIVRLGDASHLAVETIPTGSLGVDICLGVGGIPRGRITEIYGPESSGKTTLCLNVIAEAQKRGGYCAFVDMEHALDPAYAARIGVNMDTLYISQPDTGEQALDITETLVRSGALDVIVVDSVAALVPRAEIEGDMGDAHVGLQARLMSQALRKLSGAIKQSNSAVMFTNQLREKVGITYGCFSYDSTVLLADGTKLKIGQIVNQKMPVEVLSWNGDTGAFEPKRVVNWFKNGIPVDEFEMSDNEIGKLEQEYLTLVASYPHGRGFNKVTATPNHLIATPDGFRMAQDIDLGDEILCRHDQIVFSPHLEQLVVGSMMGDGSIRQGGVQTGYFREEHAPDQTEYVSWKHQSFGDLARNLRQVPNRVGFETIPLSTFGQLKDVFYRQDGRYKHITEAALRRLTPFGLAVWYLDDGSCQRANGRDHGNVIYMHTTTEDERNMIIRIFRERFALEATVLGYHNHTRIYFGKEQSLAFERIIAPYVHPSMAYKLHNPECIGVALSSLDFSYRMEQVALACPVYEIRRKLKQGQKAVRYNLQVEDNATYIVGDTIVHNSPEVTTGGRALKFYASVRLDIRRVQGIKVGGDTVGNRTKVRVTKNKVAAPFKECEFDIMFYENGISKTGEIVDIGVELGIVEKRGAFFRYNDGLLGQGRENAKQFLQENKPVSDEIEAMIRTHFGLPAMG